MGVILIETATAVCSVALSKNGRSVFEKASFDGPSHASLLGVFVDEVVQKAKAEGISIDAVAVSSGPGSYTGLRIGVSMGKGLCFGYGVPLVSIPTLKILALKAINGLIADALAADALADDAFADDALFCPMIDARRMEVYTALYDSSLRIVQDTKAEIVTEELCAAIRKTPHLFFRQWRFQMQSSHPFASGGVFRRYVPFGFRHGGVGGAGATREAVRERRLFRAVLSQGFYRYNAQKHGF